MLARSPAQPGHCGTAEGHGDCESGSKGSWVLSASAVTSWAAAQSQCVDRCLRCKRCTYVSYSRSHNDCSWFTECPDLMHTVGGFYTLQVRNDTSPMPMPMPPATTAPEACDCVMIVRARLPPYRAIACHGFDENRWQRVCSVEWRGRCAVGFSACAWEGHTRSERV